MSFSLQEINDAIRSDPRAFLDESDHEYQRKVRAAAETIARHLPKSPVVLLSGPSGSGKTTTAGEIRKALVGLGVTSYTVSLDDYYRSIKPKDFPRTETGDPDFESPLCLDSELLSQHFDQLERGEEISIPHYSFSRQMRDSSRVTPLRVGPHEAVIFEGIHALNDTLTQRHPDACKVYISARSNIERDGAVVFKNTWTRLMRRCVRDYQFRGADAVFTLGLWANVRRGEKLYISPYKNKADVIFDTSLPYEVPVLAHFAAPLFRALPDGAPRLDEMKLMLEQLPLFEPLDPALVPADSMLREFIGRPTGKEPAI